MKTINLSEIESELVGFLRTFGIEAVINADTGTEEIDIEYLALFESLNFKFV